MKPSRSVRALRSSTPSRVAFAAFAAVAVSLSASSVAMATTCEAGSVSWTKFPSADQCVTGVRGFVQAEWGITFPATGGHPTNGKCLALGACMEWVDDLPDSKVWNRHTWGGSVKPQAYDIAVFPPSGSGSGYGHIAMIDHVSGGTLWIMDDNWNGLHEKSCAWAGHSGWVHDTTWQPYGFYRLKKLEPGPDWEAQFVSQTWPDADKETIEILLGQTLKGSIKLKNTGGNTWPAGVVKLAPIPRDEASDLEAASWLSATRVSSVKDDVKPGDTGEFEWDLTGSKEGTDKPYFGLVAEGKQWFADDGGPSDKTIQISVHVSAAGGAGGGGGASSAAGKSGGAGASAATSTGGAKSTGGSGGASSKAGSSGASSAGAAGKVSGASGEGGGGAGGGLLVSGAGGTGEMLEGDPADGESSGGCAVAMSSGGSSSGWLGAMLVAVGLAFGKRRGG